MVKGKSAATKEVVVVATEAGAQAAKAAEEARQWAKVGALSRGKATFKNAGKNGRSLQEFIGVGGVVDVAALDAAYKAATAKPKIVQ
tara:strand:- start:350 stop:610 length:261 start_codon:yes stop_codon:yes gene_type:complete